MAPEVLSGKDYTSQFVDIFSIGVILFTMVSKLIESLVSNFEFSFLEHSHSKNQT
jgi:serine/threonine protein kinase